MNSSSRRVLALGLVAASSSIASVAQADSLAGAGATFPYPLYTKWFDAYNKATGTQVDYQSVGSGAGIKQLAAKTVDFGASDAPLGDKDAAKLPGKIVQIPTVAGAVAIVVNGAPQGIKLSGPVLADIFAGKVKTWNAPAIAALNAGKKLPAAPIVVAHRSDGSGTTNIFTTYLSSVSPSWKATYGAGKSVNWPVGLGGKGGDGVADLVKRTPGAIGYVELAYAIQNRLNYAAMRNRSGKFVLPSVAGATAAAQGAAAATARDSRSPIVNQGGNAYPIVGYTYIMFYTDSKSTPKGKSLLKFLNWAMGPGQKMAAPLYYAPLPSAVVSNNKSKLK
ncbi:phosphate ABC transporter substrate-binding protein PstS [bacterium]|nr:MAG: phosphate ABC transporter substrate-binding protein PstS [bacterium]